MSIFWGDSALARFPNIAFTRLHVVKTISIQSPAVCITSKGSLPAGNNALPLFETYNPSLPSKDSEKESIKFPLILHILSRDFANSSMSHKTSSISRLIINSITAPNKTTSWRHLKYLLIKRLVCLSAFIL